MSIAMTTRLSVPNDVLVQELQGESVLLNVKTGKYFGLDEVGSQMWATLSKSPNLQSAHQDLLQEFDVDADRLQTDLLAFVGALAENGLVEVHDR